VGLVDFTDRNTFQCDFLKYLLYPLFRFWVFGVFLGLFFVGFV